MTTIPDPGESHGIDLLPVLVLTVCAAIMDDAGCTRTRSKTVFNDHTLRLPFELLTSILDSCSRRTICRAAWVSQHWRAITLLHDQFYRSVLLTCGSGLDLSSTFDYVAVQLTLSYFTNIGTPLKLELRILSDATAHRGELQKVASELSRAMGVIKSLSISTVSPLVLDVLLEATRTAEAPLLREMKLAYTHVTFVGGPNRPVQWPVELFANSAPRLNSLILKEGVEPPDFSIPALRLVRSLAILKGVAQNLPLQETMPRLRDLTLQLRRPSDKEVTGVPSSDLVRNLSLPTTLKQMDVSMVLGDHLKSDILPAMIDVVRAIVAAAPISTLEHIRIPVLINRMSESATHPSAPFFDPLPVLVGLPNRIAFRPVEERTIGWSSGYQCKASITPADEEHGNGQARCVREFQSEESIEGQVNLFAPNLLFRVSRHHSLVVLDVSRGLLPDLLCTCLIFTSLERLELRLSAPSYPGRSFWPVMVKGSRVVPRPCRPDNTSTLLINRVPRLKVLWLYYRNRYSQVKNLQGAWPEEDDDLRGSPQSTADCGTTDLSASGLDALVEELGIDCIKLRTKQTRPAFLCRSIRLWLTNVVLTEDDGPGVIAFSNTEIKPVT